MAARGGRAGGPCYPNYTCTNSIGGHTDSVLCVLLGEGLIFTGSRDKTIRVLNADTKEQLYVLIGNTSGVRCLALVPGTNFLASGGEDGTIVCFDLSTLKVSFTLTGRYSRRVYSLLSVPSTTLLVACSCGATIMVWDVVTRKCVHALSGHRDTVITLANLPGNLVASGGHDGSIRVWNPATGHCVRTIDKAFGGGWVLSLVFVPGMDLLASGSDQGRIRLLRNVSTTGESTHVTTFDYKHRDWVLSLAVIPGTTLLASSSGDTDIAIWDLATGKCVQVISGHGSCVHGIAVDPATDSLLSVSGDMTLKVWTNLKAANARRRYCVLACLSSLTKKLYAGEEYAAAAFVAEEGEVEGGGGKGVAGRLQGVSAFERIASADVWRYILEFV